MPTIHPTAIVDPKAELADSVIIGPFTLIHEDVTIEAGSSIGSHCLLDNGARIGKNCVVHHGTVIATPPQDLKYAGEKTEFFLGDNTTVREYCTLNRGTTHSRKSVVGKNCLLMAYTHIAHDCVIGDNVIMANVSELGGHTLIGDFAIVGGLTAIHQFTHIGSHAMVGAGIKVVKDIPPYALVGNNPVRFEGLNSIGLRRRGFSKNTIEVLEQTYHALYFMGMNISQGVEYIKANIPLLPEVQNVLDFIASSSRGIIRPVR